MPKNVSTYLSDHNSKFYSLSCKYNIRKQFLLAERFYRGCFYLESNSKRSLFVAKMLLSG